MRPGKHLVEVVKAGGIVAWLAVAGVGILLTRELPGAWQEMLIYSLIIPTLIASFFYGRPGGLLVAMASSLISGVLAVGGPQILQPPDIPRTLFQIVLFILVALVSSEMAEREREARTRYHSLFAGTSIGIYRTTPAGRFLDANLALVQLLGCPDRESLLATDVLDFYVDPTARQQWRDLLEREGAARDFKLQLRRRDGTIIWVRDSSRACRDSAGRLLYCEGTLEDITEQVRAEEKLAAIQSLGREMVLTGDTQRIANAVVETARHVLQFGECGLWLVDPDHNALFRQAWSGEKTVSTPETLPLDGKRGISVAVVRSGEPIYLPEVAGDTRYVSIGVAARSELCVPLKVGELVVGVLNAESAQPDAFTAADQRLFQMLADVAAVALENARLHRAVVGQAARLEEQVTARTTELRERVAEVEQLNRTMATLLEDLRAANRRSQETARQLEETNAELESFAYSVSHDLRAPLRAISGFSRILREEHAPQLLPEATRYLQMIQDNAQHMGLLIDDLLTFSRLSRQPLKRQPIAPADLVRQALQDLHREQEGHCVEVTVGDLPPCEGDPVLLRQVIVNLLANALKFARKRDVARIEVGCQQGPDGESIYFVRDNGVGFDMRYATRLFGVFQRLHPDREYEGTGVGLAIVQRIVRRHGGYVWAEAEVDKGATFYFTLTGGISHD